MSQFRQHLRYNWFSKLRYLYQKQRLGYLGEDVFFDKRVELMRFPKNIHVDDEVAFKEGAKICSCNKKATIRIGKRTTIGYHTFIFASEQIEIGSDCLIAPFVYLVDSNHNIRKGKRINLQPNESAPITIGNDVWLASNVTILKGVIVSDGAVIAANSVVNCDIGAYEIWGGSPAKKIGDRQ